MASRTVIDLQRDRADETPKLPMVVGLVAPTGTRIDGLEGLLKTGLDQAGRTVHVVNLPEILRAAAVHLPRTVDGPEDERINSLRSAGITLRERSRRGAARPKGDVLALWGLKQILDYLDGLPEPVAVRTAFIVRSLKHPDEAKLFREIFGPWFFLIAGYSPAQVRHENLAKKIAEDRRKRWNKFITTAEELAEADGGSPDEPLGPQVKATFHLADAFVDVSKSETALGNDVSRLMKIVFGQLLQTPTADEAAMAQAHTAALESGFLSRQVGAVVTMPESGEVVATGYNEVPKFGGGPYLTGDPRDARDNTRRKDESYVLKEGLVQDMLARLVDAEWLSPELLAEVGCKTLPSDSVARKTEVAACAEKLAKLALEGSAPLARAEAMDVLEFHRAVHAEQAAISACARRGVPTAGKWLYVTTFPCHICAKHIIAAGIERVIYVEPYPKSYAEQLHNDAIKVDPQIPPRDRLPFEPFMGIAPRRFEQLFIVHPGERRGSRGQSSPENAWQRGIPRWESLWEFRPSYDELRRRIEDSVAEAPDPEELSDEHWKPHSTEDEVV